MVYIAYCKQTGWEAGGGSYSVGRKWCAGMCCTVCEVCQRGIVTRGRKDDSAGAYRHNAVTDAIHESLWRTEASLTGGCFPDGAGGGCTVGWAVWPVGYEVHVRAAAP